MRIKLYCEGQTERGIKTLLEPVRAELRVKGLGLDILSHNGNAQLLRKLEAKVRDSLTDGKVRAVFCLVDLRHIEEALPEVLQGKLKQDGVDWLRLSPDERVEWLRSNVPELVEVQFRGRFHLHVAVHEVEAWMLADHAALAKRLKYYSVGEWNQPERVNDDKPPAAVINELFRRHHPRKAAYHKTKDGVPLLESLGFAKVYEKCPHFKRMVDDMRSA